MVCGSSVNIVFDKEHNDAGIMPLREFESNVIVKSTDKLPNVSGIVPIKAFLSKLKTFRNTDSFPRLLGIVPLRQFFWISKNRRLLSELRADGTAPTRLLAFKAIYVKP